MRQFTIQANTVIVANSVQSGILAKRAKLSKRVGRGRKVGCINRLKDFRAVATRYDKRGRNYRAGVLVASIILWL